MTSIIYEAEIKTANQGMYLWCDSHMVMAIQTL